MVKNKLDIHEADDAEKNVLLAMWTRRAQFLINSGHPMWDPDQFTLEALQKKYENPAYFIGCIDGTPFGGFVLIERDVRYWPEKNDEAFYFHKFVVDQSWSGHGLSHELLAWVKAYGKERGKKFIRLDFDAKRSYLLKMYGDNGFKKCRVVCDASGDEITLAEYAITA